GPPGGGPPGGKDPVKDMDADGDGKVSKPEWRGPWEEFDRLDRNHDGVLDRQELKR
ncbi:MAG: EF-hand domain-containing protein, partial [Planctomycetes bacterium]|nr:EF-hand domain-containing protein [Planctomycetota bacterium]